jgi:hypothetical protein
MKRHIIFYSLLAGLFLAACSDMNSLHQEYLDRGEAIYTGVVDSLKAYPGMYRARFTWQLQADPRITKVEITWAERGMPKTAEVAVNRTADGALPMEYTLENLPEGTVSFEFVTRDAEGHRSLAASKSATVLGDDYVQNLQSRKVTAADFLYNAAGDYSLTWGVAAAELARCVVRYEAAAGGYTEISVPRSETETVLAGTKAQGKYKVVSYFNAGIDEVSKESAEQTLPPDYIAEKGLWEFADPADLGRATVGNDLTLAGAGIVASDGGALVPKSQYLLCDHGLAASRGGNKVNEYTLLIEFKVASLGQWYTFMQSDLANSSDGSFFINTSGSVGKGSIGYAGAVTAGEWQRYCVTVRCGGADQSITQYLNGVQVNANSTQGLDSGFALDVNGLILFGDNDGDDGDITVRKVALWDTALSPSECKARTKLATQP